MPQLTPARATSTDKTKGRVVMPIETPSRHGPAVSTVVRSRLYRINPFC